MPVSFLSWISLLGTEQILYFSDKPLTVQTLNTHSLKCKNRTDLDNSISHYIQTYHLNFHFHFLNSGIEYILIMRTLVLQTGFQKVTKNKYKIMFICSECRVCVCVCTRGCSKMSKPKSFWQVSQKIIARYPPIPKCINLPKSFLYNVTHLQTMAWLSKYTGIQQNSM